MKYFLIILREKFLIFEKLTYTELPPNSMNGSSSTITEYVTFHSGDKFSQQENKEKGEFGLQQKFKNSFNFF